MKEIDLNELKKIELELLKQFDEVCKLHSFKYSLAGGTLLGAIRHGGFIPWDDDIDVLMPRDDYERFIEHCAYNKNKFNYINSRNDSEYGYLFTKIYVPSTIIEEENSKYSDKKIGVYLDIFPVDSLGHNYKEAKKNFYHTQFLRELLVASNWNKYFKSKTHPWYYEPARFVFYILSRICNKVNIIKRIEKFYLNLDIADSKFSGVVCGAYREREIMSASVFESYKKIMFENVSVSIISEYDHYLKSLYGDYMKLPPVEKQISHHSFYAYYKEEK